MKIYDKRNPITVPFKDIQPGECFIDIEDELNIKIDVSFYEETEEYRPNAVTLDDGQAWRCDDDTEVIKVRTTVTIDA
jgi:hypothetical protein